LVENFGIGSHKLPFRVGHRKIHLLDALQKNAGRLINRQMHPPILEAAMIVPSQSCRRPIGLSNALSQHTKSHQNLHPIADSQNQSITIPVHKCLNQIRKMLPQPCRQNSPSCNIIAITETTRYAEHLISILQRWIFDQTIHMDPLN
jgi:hypothetical protein